MLAKAIWLLCSPWLLLIPNYKELAKNPPTHPVVDLLYKSVHVSCCFFSGYACFGIWDRVQGCCKWGANCWLLSLMLRKVDTSVLGVINFMWFQRHCFNARHVMTCVVTNVLVM